MGSVCDSPCRCCVFVSVVHPVAILSAVFCVICSLLMFVSDASGDHMVTKGSGCYLRPKTHIQHTHPPHLSTSTQTSTNHKNTQCNMMG